MLRWPIREGLLAWIEILKSRAEVHFRHEQALYGMGALKKAPTEPDILKS